jgi:acyl-CoA reductase-like NAD-dependent aldehyde dehydrogenase
MLSHPLRLRRLSSLLPLRAVYPNYINGGLSPTKETAPTFSPGTGCAVAEVAASSQADVDAAVAAAKAAFPIWSATSAAERGRVLFEAARIMKERNGELAMVETIDAGSVVSETTTAHILGAADAFVSAGGGTGGGGWPGGAARAL